MTTMNHPIDRRLLNIMKEDLITIANQLQAPLVTTAMLTLGTLVAALQYDLQVFSEMILALSCIYVIVNGAVMLYTYRVKDTLVLSAIGALLATATALLFYHRFNSPVIQMCFSITSILVMNSLARMTKCACLGTCKSCPLPVSRRATDIGREFGSLFSERRKRA